MTKLSAQVLLDRQSELLSDWTEFQVAGWTVELRLRPHKSVPMEVISVRVNDSLGSSLSTDTPRTTSSTAGVGVGAYFEQTSPWNLGGGELWFNGFPQGIGVKVDDTTQELSVTKWTRSRLDAKASNYLAVDYAVAAVLEARLLPAPADGMAAIRTVPPVHIGSALVIRDALANGTNPDGGDPVTEVAQKPPVTGPEVGPDRS